MGRHPPDRERQDLAHAAHRPARPAGRHHGQDLGRRGPGRRRGTDRARAVPPSEVRPRRERWSPGSRLVCAPTGTATEYLGPAMSERPIDDLRTWGAKTLEALSDAMDKLVRQRQATEGITAA